MVQLKVIHQDPRQKTATSTKWHWCYWGKSIHLSFSRAKKMVLRVPWKRGRTRWYDRSISWIWTERSQAADKKNEGQGDQWINAQTVSTDGFFWVDGMRVSWFLGGRLLGWVGTSWANGARFLLINISQKNGSLLTEFPTVFVASSARCEEKSSYFGHVKIHRRIPESFLVLF